jgi:hypothetical protein
MRVPRLTGLPLQISLRQLRKTSAHVEDEILALRRQRRSDAQILTGLGKEKAASKTEVLLTIACGNGSTRNVGLVTHEAAP